MGRVTECFKSRPHVTNGKGREPHIALLLGLRNAATPRQFCQCPIKGPHKGKIKLRSALTGYFTKPVSSQLNR